jgi:hypothetical protein
MIPKTEYVTEWFKRGSGTALRLSLAAFGKHPGWEDHIPGIGVDTEALAELKQSLYFDGIRGQIDSGAWEKMEQIKRLEGFDHQFLWLRPGHTLLGLMWSSSDRIGRAKYPMILCADGEGYSPAFMLVYARPALEQLRDACKSLTSAEEVTSECRVALDRLRGTFERSGEGWAEPFADKSERRRFLDCAELSPGRAGFLRILHEYSTEQGVATTGTGTKHLRVPVINGMATDAFTPWVEFFKCVVPAKIPVLFIKRNDSTWLDVIIGEPGSRDFFCLQAATEALPLTTQVPYEISEDTRSTLDDIAARFGLSNGPAKKARPQNPPAPVAPPGVSSGTKGGGKSLLIVGIVIILVLLAAGAVILLLKGNNSPAKSGSAPVNKMAAPAAPPSQVAVDGMKYNSAIQAATDAFAKGDYDGAIRQANLALDAAPGDQAAMQIRTDATNKKRDAAAQADAKARYDQYASAMAHGRDALANKNYTEAARQAGIALKLEAGDSAAKSLMTEALNSQSDEKVKQEYAAAMQAARQNIDLKNYGEAIRDADAALTVKPGDTEAVAIKANATTAEAYQTAMQAAQAAYDNKNYDVAAQQAMQALSARPGDPAAEALKNNASMASDAQKNGAQYQSEIGAVQDAWNKGDFNTVIQHAYRALQISPNNADVKARLRDSVYNELAIYAVWFGVTKPEDASTAFAKKAIPLAQGDMPPSEANAYKNQIDGWIKILNAYQLLDDPHSKLAAAIESNINRY